VVREKWGPLEWLVNFGCWLAHLLRLPLASLDPESIRRSAQRTTKLSDIGNPDSLAGMEQILGEVRERRENALTRVYFRSLCKRSLVNRLRTRAALASSPSIRDIPIERPIFVLGFPRTGTTLIQNLLTREAGRRSLEFWELTRPAPLHPDPEQDRRQRVALCEQDLLWAYRACPEMAAIHEIHASTAEECWPLMTMAFSALSTDISQGLRSYGNWLLEQDVDWVYREYREALQLLLHREAADQLVLKCPEHLWFLDSLFEAFPDACVVWTHRDPIDCIASYCSMVSLNLRAVWSGFDSLNLGEHISHRFHQGVSRAMAVRDKVGEDRFFDVNFFELVQDPLAIVDRIQDHFGLLRTAEGRAAMQSYLLTDRKDSRGQHRYSAERYGLRPDEVQERFSEYRQRFGIS